MELTEEFIKEHNLSPEQVKAIDSHVEGEYIPTLKKDWDGKASKDADGILDGVARAMTEKYGVKDLQREEGEKWADWVGRLTEAKLGADQQTLAQKRQELDDKLKNFKGSEELKQQLEEERKKIDGYQQKLAKLEPLEGLDEKYKKATEELTGLKKRVAFNSVKPAFPDTVNSYEAKDKWNTFVKGVEDDYTIEIVDDEYIAIDKENPHKTKKLSELVKADQDIQGLLVGRKQKGTGGTGKPSVSPDGVDYDVPENATTQEKTQAVREHLISKGVKSTDDNYSAKFKEEYEKLTEALTKK